MDDNNDTHEDVRTPVHANSGPRYHKHLRFNERLPLLTNEPVSITCT